MNTIELNFEGTLNQQLGYIEFEQKESFFILPKPPWLLTDDWLAENWLIKNSNGNDYSINFKTILPDGSWLTDNQHKSSLDTIKVAIILSRNGKSSIQFTGSGETQSKLARSLICVFKYVNLRGLEYFSDLTFEHLEAMTDEFVYGVSEALEYSSRFIAMTNQFLKENSESLPTINNNELDSKTICNRAGIDLNSWRNDKRGHYVRLNIAIENNLIVPKKYQNLDLSADFERKVQNSDSLRKFYKALHFLWQINSFTKKLQIDYLQENPFRDMSYYEKAEAKGLDGKRTGTIPEPVALHIIDRSLRWVLDYGPELLELRDKSEALHAEYKLQYKDNYPEKKVAQFLSEYKPEHTGEGDPWPIKGFLRGSRDTKKLTLYQAVNGFLPLACLIVIIAFTARRKVEIETAKSGCVAEIDGELWMTTYIAKTDQENATFPTIASVEKAVELLENWSQNARNLTGREELFQVKALHKNVVYSFLWKEWIKNFADHVDVPLCDSGEKWQFAQHQFRRFFAMMYFWRFDIKGLQYLCDHLHHFDFEMTLKYVTEIISGAVFNEETKRRVKSYFDKIRAGDDDLIGPMTDEMTNELKKARTLMERSVRTGREGALDKWVDDYIEKVGFILSFKPWGMCYGETPKLKNKSLCIDDSGLLLEKEDADIDLCRNCPNFASHKELLKNYKPKKAEPDINVCESVILQAVISRRSVCEDGVNNV